MRREGVIDGLPTEMIVNTALKGYDKRGDFPFHVWVAVGYRGTEETAGLPTPKETRSLEALEDTLLAAIRKAGEGHYIGQSSWNGTREFNFYVDDPELTDERLEALATPQKRPIHYEICEDPTWQRVEFFFDYES
ncbi:MAG: DUF695 domain-containing protein [Puniceicoccales bacterium]